MAAIFFHVNPTYGVLPYSIIGIGDIDEILLPRGLPRLIVSFANGSPFEVTHAFHRVKFHLMAQNGYFQLKLRLHFNTDQHIYTILLLVYMYTIR